MQKQNTTAKRSSTANGKGQSQHRETNAGNHLSNSSAKANRSAQTSKSGQAADDSRLKEFFIDELKDIYWAEKKLVKTLPKLQKAATSPELQQAFASHLKETEGHVARLEEVFKLVDEKAQAKKCDAMEGITEEGASVIEDTEKGTATRDVALVMAGQKAEHYEIATYGSLITIAKTLGLDDVADILGETLQEEKAADQKLTDIAENSINYSAASETE
jgi:ferritin-like metal-binding protein YciE